MSRRWWFVLKRLVLLGVALVVLVQPALVSAADPSSEANALQEQLRLIVPPYRDEVDIARRFRYPCGASVPGSVAWNVQEEVGTERQFWVIDEPKRIHFQATATLRHASEHLLLYVQNGASVSSRALARSARIFEANTLPLLEHTFGALPDGLRITIFNGRIPGIGGYFASSDLLPTAVNRFSNERPMLYMNTNVFRAGTFIYDAVLAHELQHMIHFFVHPQQDAWINEGASEVAMAVTGHLPLYAAEAFVRRPATQLDSWASSPSQSVAHYGAAYLFMTYLAERLGLLDSQDGDGLTFTGLRDLIATAGIGTVFLDTYLSQQDTGLTFASLFRDWVVANVLNDKDASDDGRYGYDDWDGRMAPAVVWRSYPQQLTTDVTQHAAHYVELRPPAGASGTLEITFSGQPTVRLVGTDAHQGSGMWWSRPADNSESTLTRRVDLSDVSSAQLEFATWYDLEEGYDYAFVGVSTDNGCTWTTLPGQYTTTDDPVGHNLGHGYNGRSGGGAEPQWLEETVDLTPYAGREVLLRFHHITDQAYHGAGILLDNIRIAAIDFTDDAEAASDYWTVVGFVRSTNVVPQQWSVQAVLFDAEGSVVTPLALDTTDTAVTGTLRVSTDEIKQLILVLAPMTSTQGQPAPAIIQARFTSGSSFDADLPLELDFPSAAP